MMAYLQKIHGLTALQRPPTWSSTRGSVSQFPATCSGLIVNSQLIRGKPRGIPQSTRQFFENASLRSRGEPEPRHQPDVGYKPSGKREYEQPRFRNPNLVVGSVIAICSGIFGWHYVYEEEARKGSWKARQALANSQRHMVLSLQNIREGRYYTVLTSTFMHTTPLHLIINMMTLWSFGRLIVGIYGVPTFVVLWVGAGVFGGAAQSYYWLKQPRYAERSAVGASGSILGMLGALTCAMPQSRVTLIVFPMSLLQSTLLMAGLSAAAIQQDWLPFVGHMDHLGGMAFGAFWYLLAMRRGRLGGLRL
jgi:membrane associated rhomboid family serine protease